MDKEDLEPGSGPSEDKRGQSRNEREEDQAVEIEEDFAGSMEDVPSDNEGQRCVARVMGLVGEVYGCAFVSNSSESGEDDQDKQMGELGEESQRAGQGEELDRNMWAPEEEKEQGVGGVCGCGHVIK